MKQFVSAGVLTVHKCKASCVTVSQCVCAVQLLTADSSQQSISPRHRPAVGVVVALQQAGMEQMTACVVSTLATDNSTDEDLAADCALLMKEVFQDNAAPTLPSGVEWALFDRTISLLLAEKLRLEQDAMKQASQVCAVLLAWW